ncbi:MAG: 30S ribosomal protein S12 methylthiotransferase RimO [Chloroflexi bacterium]|nr:30S ribosomal protein S12 methylthiotransferase RimO [Chloroflexota bacterium]MCY3587180.1 30S ribosomal protein S12 methylthiotransferase RimO [Chloroflexota bacterium]MCY3685887.1 30S ribosomal protein S12 methylthiotransferase RimO [Chloroflexota bacterium]MDE2709655.1 30S ribosomal protein S12 methylthiotransferase RimO [Chloroflexota bacterium]
MRYQIVTLGCPKNTTDSDRIARELEQAGHRSTGDRQAADLVILNTCGFIDDARDESRQAAELLAAERLPSQQVVVTGCWSQIEREQVIAIDGIGATFGIEAWQQIAEHAGAVEPERDIPETSIGIGPSAYLKISDGCARPCTFCNIPAIKGRQFRSVEPDALVREARDLVGRGAREVVLVAQDSTAYGAEWGDANGLARLIERLAVESGADWLRLMYAYPGFVTPSLVEVMANTPQVCRYLDIPLQHGSPSVLRRMKRPHNMSMVRGTLDRLRQAMPDIAIRTTFIVGFPGETDSEFQELLQFASDAEFDRAGAFVYSPQDGTPAAVMSEQIAEDVKQRRHEELMLLLADVSARKNERQVGRRMTMLVESEPGQTTEDGEPIIAGRTYREAAEVDGLVFALGEAAPGEFRPVEIVEAMGHDLWAELVD